MKNRHIDLISESWEGIMSNKDDKLTRLMIIGKVFENNGKLFDLINKQIYLLNKYSSHLEDVTNVKDNVKGLEELLELVGLTGSDFDDEWDDEMGRKS